MTPKNYLFVCGCPRSGTSALARLLCWSDEIVLGMERYGKRIRPANFALTPALFEKERFLNVQEGDTFYDSLDSMPFYKNVALKIDSCRYIGEKRPELYLYYDQLFKIFPGATIFFIFRDLLEVASSYNVRARKGTWPAKKDYKAAVKEWNQSFACTLRARRDGFPVHCVEYKDVFKASSNHAMLFKMLDLEFDDKIAHGVRTVVKRAEDLAEKRKLELTARQIQFLKKKANFDSLNELRKIKIKLAP